MFLINFVPFQISSQNDSEFTLDDVRRLFGQEKVDVDEVFAKLDRNNDGEVRFIC